MRLSARQILSLVIAALVTTAWAAPPVSAVISSCSANVSPHTVTQSTNKFFDVTVNNTDSNSIRWVEITLPSSNFSFTGAGSSGWSSSFSGQVVTFTGSSLNPSASRIFQVGTASGSSDAPTANWIVKVSDNSSGLSPFNCSGDLGTGISGPSPDLANPQITEISLSALTATSVTISWKTDEPATSVVNYGLTDGYGSIVTDNSLKTTHQLILTNLSPDTGYHYGVGSADAAGNLTIDDGYTLLTPLAPPPSQIIQVPADAEKVKPTVTISTKLNSVYKDPPTISGRASDNNAVSTVEYSTDGGIGWIKVDKALGLGGKNVTFEFRPVILEDGNYQVIARAIDKVGNIGTSPVQTLVIDRLPPIVGANMVAFGPQILLPGSDGVLRTLAGVDQRITVSAGGGPIRIDLVATKDKKESARFSLTRSQATGLWTGIMGFKQSGNYEISAIAVDGADKRTERSLNSVLVSEPSRLRSSNGQTPIAKAKVTLYYLEPITNSWTVWDGRPYGQVNPQDTSDLGEFRLFAPPGRYYLSVDAPGHRGLISSIFTLERPTPLTVGLIAQSLPSLSLRGLTLTLPFPPEGFEVLPKDESDKNVSSLVGERLPDFTLADTAGKSVRSLGLGQKPTIITVISTWSPATSEQLPTLSDLYKNKDLSVITLTTLESAGRVRAYTTIGRYEISPLIDRSGTLVGKLQINSLPAHFFISRDGVIKNILFGVLSKEELTAGLTGL